jgi:hypothetical protein
MGKLRQRRVRQVAQVSSGLVSVGWDSNPGSLTPTLSQVLTMGYFCFFNTGTIMGLSVLC